jgi:DNA helicase-2/ATP-dependent DNA helicase PcrA
MCSIQMILRVCLCASLFDRAMLPSDFLLYDGSTYVQDFAHEYEEHEMVIFDTETTGP